MNRMSKVYFVVLIVFAVLSQRVDPASQQEESVSSEPYPYPNLKLVLNAEDAFPKDIKDKLNGCEFGGEVFLADLQRSDNLTPLQESASDKLLDLKKCALATTKIMMEFLHRDFKHSRDLENDGECPDGECPDTTEVPQISMKNVTLHGASLNYKHEDVEAYVESDDPARPRSCITRVSISPDNRTANIICSTYRPAVHPVFEKRPKEDCTPMFLDCKKKLEKYLYMVILSFQLIPDDYNMMRIYLTMVFRRRDTYESELPIVGLSVKYTTSKIVRKLTVYYSSSNV